VPDPMHEVAAGRPAGGVWTSALVSGPVAAVLERAVVLRGVHPVCEVDSTQDVALELARSGAATGMVVVADRQRRGRGQRGRRWDDAPDGGSLALTLLLRTPARDVTLVPLAVGLAVAGTAAQRSAARVALKWPNDVVVRGADVEGCPSLRKLGGILVQREHVASRDVLLVGVGLNVDHRSLPPRPDRTCLASLADPAVVEGGAGRRDAGVGSQEDAHAGRVRLLVDLIAALDVRLDQLRRDPAGTLAAYRASSDTLGRDVDVELVHGGRVSGTAQDVDRSGRLVIGVGGDLEAVHAGTVRDRATNPADAPHPALAPSAPAADAVVS